MKLLLLTHNLGSISVRDDLEKTREYFKRHLDLDIQCVVQPTKTKPVDGWKEAKTYEGKHDIVGYLFDRKGFVFVQATGSIFPAPSTLGYIYLPILKIEDDLNYLWMVICHEIIHVLHRLVEAKLGIKTNDTMDWYDYNWDLEHPNGNFARNIKELKPHIKTLFQIREIDNFVCEMDNNNNSSSSNVCSTISQSSFISSISSSNLKSFYYTVFNPKNVTTTGWTKSSIDLVSFFHQINTGYQFRNSANTATADSDKWAFKVITFLTTSGASLSTEYLVIRANKSGTTGWTYFFHKLSYSPIMTHKTDKVNARSLEKWGLIPSLEKKAELFLEKAKQAGFNLKITQGFRDPAYQDKLYAQGRTLPGKIVTNATGKTSKHCLGKAFDIAFVGKDPYPKNANWKTIADIGVSCGLKAGYYFKSFKDMLHFET